MFRKQQEQNIMMFQEQEKRTCFSLHSEEAVIKQRF